MSLVTKPAQPEFLFEEHQAPMLSSWAETVMHFSSCHSGDCNLQWPLKDRIWSRVLFLIHNAALLSFDTVLIALKTS